MTTELINSLKETISLLELEYNREAKNFESETDYIDKAISQQRLDQLEDTIKQLERCIRNCSQRVKKGFVNLDNFKITNEESKQKENELLDLLNRSLATSNPPIQLYSSGNEIKFNPDLNSEKDIGGK